MVSVGNSLQPSTRRTSVPQSAPRPETPSLFPPEGTQVRELAGLGFHPAVAEWFARRFPEGPTPAQQQGWAQIARGATR